MFPPDTYTWIEHFKSPLNMDYTNNFPKIDILNFFGLDDTILNVPISIQELRKSINRLKNVMWS